MFSLKKPFNEKQFKFRRRFERDNTKAKISRKLNLKTELAPELNICSAPTLRTTLHMSPPGL